jgi:hypothetical protein
VYSKVGLGCGVSVFSGLGGAFSPEFSAMSSTVSGSFLVGNMLFVYLKTL